MLRPALTSAVAVAFVAVLALGLAVRPVQAFDATAGGPHDEVTRSAIALTGFPPDGVDALVQAVRAADGAEHRGADEHGDVRVSSEYEPSHHCDRVPPATDAAAFNATVAYIASQRDLASDRSLQGDASGAVQALGDALHALQDCFAHSDAIDLADPSQVVHAVNGHLAMPPDLLLTGFQPGASPATSPPGDRYPAGLHALESKESKQAATVMPDNRTRLQAAEDLATDATALFLQEWLAQQSPGEVAALAEVHAGQGGALPRPAPGLAFAPLVPGLGVVAWALRKRG